jgi:thioredoxin reductase/NAD-dependent dihydropyrimidine dehydrogenase PreA subunit
MPGDQILVWTVGGALALSAVVPFVLRHHRRERHAIAASRHAVEHGLHEPVSLHPVVDPDRCIGTGRCIEVCPEHDVLGMRNGQAVPVSPARCIGHGLCERSCPMEAIQLVFGTEKRGVELPRIRRNFETNVPGIYIVGELGGMGLIGNAFEQGRQCIEGIMAEKRAAPAGMHDAVIVGCGPAGLSAALTALHHGLKVVTIEKEDLGGTVRHYPRKKLVMTRALKVPGYGTLPFREVRKEELVETWEEIVERAGLEVRTGETVQAIDKDGGGFVVRSDRGEHRALRVILAIGRRGVPRKLGVPGEESAKVVYALREPEAFQGDRILVVGGGDSAVEAALALADQPGNEVTLSYRRDRLSRIKPANHQRFEAAVADGRVRPLWGTEVLGIESDSVTMAQVGEAGNGDGSEPRTVPNDRVFVFIGGELPTRFLKECGVEIDVKFGVP